MSKLAAPTKEDFMLDLVFAGLKVVKIKMPVRFYRCTTQLVPGFDIGSYEGLSVNVEVSSFWNSSTCTSQGTTHECLELYSFHDNGSYGVPSITLEGLVGASYEEPYAEFELTGFHDSGGYVYGYVYSGLCDVQDGGEYSGAFELHDFSDGGGSFDECNNISAGPSRDRSHDGYGDTLGPSDIQDSDSSDDVLESRGCPPPILLCDTAGKLQFSGTR